VTLILINSEGICKNRNRGQELAFLTTELSGHINLIKNLFYKSLEITWKKDAKIIPNIIK